MTHDTAHDGRSITPSQRALCDCALLDADHPNRAAAFAHSHDGAELLALLTRTSSVPGYLAGTLATVEGAKRLIQLCRALSPVTTDPRTTAELHALAGLASLAIAQPGMAELHAGAALTLQPAHPAANQLTQLLRDQASPAEVFGTAQRAYASTAARH